MVTSQEDSTAVKDCIVYLNDGKKSVLTDNHGKFLFEDVASGKHTLHFVSIDFKYYKIEVTVSSNNQHLRITLEPRLEEANEGDGD